jgi:sortase (surface protein transpeptidase)
MSELKLYQIKHKRDKVLMSKVRDVIINNPKKNDASSASILLIPIISLVLMIFGVTSCMSEAEESMQLKIDHEQNEFQKQLKQDPRTWDKAQDDRYNNLKEWERKQN